jgi:hypothetical protein
MVTLLSPAAPFGQRLIQSRLQARRRKALAVLCFGYTISVYLRTVTFSFDMVHLSRKTHKLNTAPQTSIDIDFDRPSGPHLKGEKWKAIENYVGSYRS